MEISQSKSTKNGKEIYDFSEYALLRKISGFSKASPEFLRSLHTQLGLKMSIKELAELKKHYTSSNPPSILELKALDSYWSGSVGYFDRAISQIEIATSNPHVKKALELYNKIYTELGETAPRTLKNISSISTKYLVNHDLRTIEFFGDKPTMGADCFEKNRKTRLYFNLFTRFSNGRVSAATRGVVKTLSTGYVPLAIIRNEINKNNDDNDLMRFGKVATEAGLPAFEFIESRSDALPTNMESATVIGFSERKNATGTTINDRDIIVSISPDNTIKSTISRLIDIVSTGVFNEYLVVPVTSNEGIFNSLVWVTNGFEIYLRKLPLGDDSCADFLFAHSLKKQVLIVKRQYIKAFAELCKEYHFTLTEIGHTSSDGQYRITTDGVEIFNLPASVLKLRKHSYAVSRIVDDYKENEHLEPKNSTFTEIISQLKSGYFKTDFKLDGTFNARTLRAPMNGNKQLTPTQVIAVRPSISSYDDLVALATVTAPYEGIDVFSSVINTAVLSILKLVMSGVAPHQIAIAVSMLYSARDDKFMRGNVLSAELAMLTLQNALSIGMISSNALPCEIQGNKPIIYADALGVSFGRNLIDNTFKKGDKVFYVHIDRDEYGVQDFRSLLYLMNTVNVNISKGNITAGALVDVSVMDTIIKCTAGNGLGFSFAKIDEDTFNNSVGDIVFAIDDIEEMGSIESYYLGVVDDSGIIKGADVSITQSGIEKIISKHPFEDVIENRTKIVEPVKKELHKYTGDCNAPEAILISYDKSAMEVYESIFAKIGVKTHKILAKPTLESTPEYIRNMREKIGKARIMVVCGQASWGAPGENNKLYDTLKLPPILDAINELIFRNDGLVLATGEGTKALVELGFLPFGTAEHGGLKFEENIVKGYNSKLQKQKIVDNNNVWLKNTHIGEIIYASHPGNKARLKVNRMLHNKLMEKGQINAQYLDCNDVPTLAYPYNPTGNTGAISAISSPDGRILGFFASIEKSYSLTNGSSEILEEMLASAKEYFEK